MSHSRPPIVLLEVVALRIIISASPNQQVKEVLCSQNSLRHPRGSAWRDLCRIGKPGPDTGRIPRVDGHRSNTTPPVPAEPLSSDLLRLAGNNFAQLKECFDDDAGGVDRPARSDRRRPDRKRLHCPQCGPVRFLRTNGARFCRATKAMT